ncbi:MAG: helix-turn-helix domain-containing protein [Candidatus Thermoplasmatota archaeon]|nr:helix-turn-helix domain-containing protein [Candidatus Thermoplasmatota archaeon]
MQKSIPQIALMEVEMEFKQPVKWIRDVVQTHSASIRIRDIRMSSEGARDLIEIFMPGGEVKGLSSELIEQKRTKIDNVTIMDDSHATAIVNAHECAVCRAILNWDLFLTEAYSNETGDIIMKWLVPDEATVKGFLDRLEEDGVQFELLKKRALTKRGDITARQEYVVKTALELGFFDYPKKVNLEGLSRRLNVSYVTLAEILRRAEKNIISSYFKKKEE